MPQPFADSTVEQLLDADWLADEIARLGLERHEPLAPRFPRNFGGMLIWQTPIQFAPYLVALSKISIGSYAELGVHAGGSMIATVSYLDRFRRVRSIMAVDMAFQDRPRQWLKERGGVAIESQTRSVEVEAWLEETMPDLVFIDADHGYHGCKADYQMVSRYARYVGMHDIVEYSTPGVRQVWDEIDAPKVGFTAQYPEAPAPLHGVGLVGPLR